jgi:hypothetical protein
MLDIPAIHRPPPGRWIRLHEAASRLGVSPVMLAADIAAGRAALRFQHFGHRRLLHVAETDLHALAAKLHAGEVSA